MLAVSNKGKAIMDKRKIFIEIFELLLYLGKNMMKIEYFKKN